MPYAFVRFVARWCRVLIIILCDTRNSACSRGRIDIARIRLRFTCTNSHIEIKAMCLCRSTGLICNTILKHKIQNYKRMVILFVLVITLKIMNFVSTLNKIDCTPIIKGSITRSIPIFLYPNIIISPLSWCC